MDEEVLDIDDDSDVKVSWTDERTRELVKKKLPKACKKKDKCKPTKKSKEAATTQPRDPKSASK